MSDNGNGWVRLAESRYRLIMGSPSGLWYQGIVEHGG